MGVSYLWDGRWVWASVALALLRKIDTTGSKVAHKSGPLFWPLHLTIMLRAIILSPTTPFKILCMVDWEVPLFFWKLLDHILSIMGLIQVTIFLSEKIFTVDEFLGFFQPPEQFSFLFKSKEFYLVCESLSSRTNQRIYLDIVFPSNSNCFSHLHDVSWWSRLRTHVDSMSRLILSVKAAVPLVVGQGPIYLSFHILGLRSFPNDAPHRHDVGASDLYDSELKGVCMVQNWGGNYFWPP